jgi:hypothetical protein
MAVNFFTDHGVSGKLTKPFMLSKLTEALFYILQKSLIFYSKLDQFYIFQILCDTLFCLKPLLQNMPGPTSIYQDLSFVHYSILSFL